MNVIEPCREQGNKVKLKLCCLQFHTRNEGKIETVMFTVPYHTSHILASSRAIFSVVLLCPLCILK